MLDLASTPPARRSDLVIRPGDEGACVVKDPLNASYYRFASQEAFLLQQLDGSQPAQKICNEFQRRFDLPLSAGELQQFVDQARALGLLQPPGRAAGPPPAIQPATAAPANVPPSPAPSRQSILYFRVRLLNPDLLISVFEPLVRWAISSAFACLIAACALAAACVSWSNRLELLNQIPLALRWETALYAWLAIAAATLCHEFAHGFACKRHGGEVRDMGFLLMFLMPCFYCNVSDAWLFPRKSQRLHVTLAGPFCDLLLWSLAVFTWRLTVQDSLPNYVAWITLSILGVRLVFNLNPLMKLDGYYLLSDWIEIPNLRDRSWEFVRAQFRRVVLGAPKPPPEKRPVFLFCFGMASWWYAFAALSLAIFFVGQVLARQFGWPGVAGTAIFTWLLLRGLCRGFFGGELSNMLVLRHVRTVCWTVALGCAAAAFCLTVGEDTATGTLLLRAAHRAEVRAPAAGFLAEVFVKEGECVAADAPLVRLSVPDLASRISQKHAEFEEMEAKFRLLSAGPRSEEEAEQRRRIERAEARVVLAAADLRQRRSALDAELAEIDLRIKQFRLESEWAAENYKRLDGLFSKGATSKWERDESLKKSQVLLTQCEQAQAQRNARKALGVSAQEAELARWTHDLAEARGQLVLMTARPHEEEIEAATARVTRLREEICYLENVQKNLRIDCSVAGVLATPRLTQNIGQYFREGELICEVEDPSELDAEVSVSEQDASRISVGQEVRLTVRGLLLETVNASIIRIAPKALPGQLQSTFMVQCRMKQPPPSLRPGMTGNARIVCGRKPLADILAERILRVVRSEFWW